MKKRSPRIIFQEKIALPNGRFAILSAISRELDLWVPEDEVVRCRNLDCEFYDVCLKEAIRAKMVSFSCAECPLFWTRISGNSEV